MNAIVTSDFAQKKTNTDLAETKAAARLQGDGQEKVLRDVWNSQEDVLTYKAKPWSHYSQAPTELSKRQILSNIARIYDPIGFASSFLIKASGSCITESMTCDQ